MHLGQALLLILCVVENPQHALRLGAKAPQHAAENAFWERSCHLQHPFPCPCVARHPCSVGFASHALPYGEAIRRFAIV